MTDELSKCKRQNLRQPYWELTNGQAVYDIRSPDIWPGLLKNYKRRFFKVVKREGQGHKVKMFVPAERLCYKEYTCIERSISFGSKVMAKVKVFFQKKVKVKVSRSQGQHVGYQQNNFATRNTRVI